MGIFGKKERKTLEQRARKINITIGVPSSKDAYGHCTIKGAGESIEAAEDRLLENVMAAGGTHLSDITHPEINKIFHARNYVISGTAYRPIKFTTSTTI